MSKNEAQSKNEAHFDRCSFISIIATAPAFIVTNSMEYTSVGEFETIVSDQVRHKPDCTATEDD